jgi:hypothetical protein
LGIGEPSDDILIYGLQIFELGTGTSFPGRADPAVGWVSQRVKKCSAHLCSIVPIMSLDARRRSGSFGVSQLSLYLFWVWRAWTVDTVHEASHERLGIWHAWQRETDEVWGLGLGIRSICHHITAISLSLLIFSCMMTAHSKRACIGASDQITNDNESVNSRTYHSNVEQETFFSIDGQTARSYSRFSFLYTNCGKLHVTCHDHNSQHQPSRLHLQYRLHPLQKRACPKLLPRRHRDSEEIRRAAEQGTRCSNTSS